MPPEKGLFSQNFDVPSGALDLFSREDENNVDPANTVIQNLTDPNVDITEIAAGTTVYWGQIEDDATITADSGITSCTRIAEGIYDVVTDTSFAATGSQWQAAAVVSPESIPTTAGTAVEAEYYGLHTVSVDIDQSAVCYDSVRGWLWATDENSQALGFDENGEAGGSSDRIAIYKQDADEWLYIYLPDDWATNFLQDGCMLKLNVLERVAYVQAAGTGANAGKRTTLIYSLDTLALLSNTYSDISTGDGNNFYVVGFDNTNDRIMLYGGASTRVYNMVDGIPTSQIDSDPSQYSITQYMIADASGNFWFPEGGPPADWRRWYLSASTLTTDTVDAGTGGIDSAANAFCYDATNDKIFFYTSDKLTLKSMACTGGNTITSIHTYTAPDGTNHATEAAELYALAMSADDFRLLGVRGGTSGGSTCCFYIIDPSDGSIDFHYDLTNTYTSNYGTINVAVDYGVLWSLGSNRIQEIRFSGAEEDTGLTIYDPVFHAVMFTAANKVRVQFFKGNNFRVHQDSAFHIHITGTAA